MAGGDADGAGRGLGDAAGVGVAETVGMGAGDGVLVGVAEGRAGAVAVSVAMAEGVVPPRPGDRVGTGATTRPARACATTRPRGLVPWRGLAMV
ncbi:MAG: hypothetical protein NVSMB65_13390 [Chloroflexota bacterium]